MLALVSRKVVVAVIAASLALSFPTNAVAAQVGGGVPQLAASPTQISVFTGGAHRLALEAGVAHNLDFYLVLGSSRGTSPGLNYGGFNLPLNPTGPYFRFSVMQPNTSVMVNTFGVLDMQGRATAEVRVPAGLPSLIGIELHHAFVVMNPILGVTAVSNATSLRLGF